MQHLRHSAASKTRGRSHLPRRRFHAFSIVELAIVVVVMSVAAALVVPTFSKLTDNSRDETAKRTLDAVYSSATALAMLDGRTTYSEADLLAAIAELPGDSGIPGDSASGVVWTYAADGVADEPFEIAVAVSPDGSTVGLSAISQTGNPTFLQGTVTDSSTWVVDLDETPACPGSAGAVLLAEPGDCPAVEPSVPALTGVTPGDGSLSVAFTGPASDGGAPISNYEYSTDDGVTWVTRTPASTVSPVSITGLSNGTSYIVKLRAVNLVGPSLATAGVSATPYTTPSAPTIDAVTPGSGSLSVAFTAGATGGSAITGYEYDLDGAGSWAALSGTTSPQTITGLTNGTSYAVRIRAANAAGASSASGAVAATPFGNPQAPGAPSASSITETTMTLTWTAPGDDGGAAVTQYRVMEAAAGLWATVTSPTLTYDVTGLTAGTEYTWTVVACNSATSCSPASASTTVPTIPAPPGGASLSDGSIVVDWDPSPSSAVDGYRVLFQPAVDLGVYDRFNRSQVSAKRALMTAFAAGTHGQANWGGNPRRVHITHRGAGLGLTRGTQYKVWVVAYNSSGESLPVDGSRTYITPPAAPASPTVTSPSATQLDVSWSAPDDGDSPITGYTVQLATNTSFTTGLESKTVVTTSTSFTGLTAGTTYYVRVAATNARGTSSYSTRTTQMAGAAPTAPRDLVVSGSSTSSCASSGFLQFNWRQPSSMGSGTFSRFEFDFDDTSSFSGGTYLNFNSNTSGTTYFQGCIPLGHARYFRVRAWNSDGLASPWAQVGPVYARSAGQAGQTATAPELFGYYSSASHSQTTYQQYNGQYMCGYNYYNGRYYPRYCSSYVTRPLYNTNPNGVKLYAYLPGAMNEGSYPFGAVAAWNWERHTNSSCTALQGSGRYGPSTPYSSWPLAWPASETPPTGSLSSTYWTNSSMDHFGIDEIDLWSIDQGDNFSSTYDYGVYRYYRVQAINMAGGTSNWSNCMSVYFSYTRSDYFR